MKKLFYWLSIVLFLTLLPAYSDMLYPNLEQSWGSNLYGDFRSRQSGEMVLVIFDLSSQSLQSANLRNDKNNQINSNLLLDTLSPLYPALGGANNDQQNAAENLSQRLQTTMSAQVMEVKPNGNMLIEGQREGWVNKEKLLFVLKGEIRPCDITRDNAILSSRIMNLSFDYIGPLSNKLSPGLIQSIIRIIF